MKTQQVKRIILALVVLTIFLVLRYAQVGEYFTLESLKLHKHLLKEWVSDNYLLAVSSYIIVYIISVAFSVPGAAVLTISGGFIFGVVAGSIYVNFAATTGAVTAFLVSRYLLGSWIQVTYAKALARFNRELERNGVSCLLTLRLIPIFPFFLINLFAGLTRLPLRTFVWTTMLGIIPGSVVFTFAGRQLDTIESVKDIFSMPVLLAFLFLSLLALLPIVYRRLFNVNPR